MIGSGVQVVRFGGAPVMYDHGRAPVSSLMRTIEKTLCLLALLPACSPHRIEVTLVHSRALVPESVFGEVTLRIVDADDGRVVHEGSTAGTSLARAVTLFDATDLAPGERYVAELEADAGAVCARGRAVGRSTPFVHEEDDYAVSIQIGCADAFTSTARDPDVPRMAHRLVTTTDGDAMLIGGASTIQFAPAPGTLGFEGFTATTERYDPTRGEFVPGGQLVSPRIVPAVVALPGGEVGVMGGVQPTAPLCESSIEIVAGLSSATAGSLAHPRCWPSAVWLPALSRAVVIGGQEVASTAEALDRTRDAEAYDASLRSRLSNGIAGRGYLVVPEVIPLADGESALVVAGVPAWMPTPVVSRMRADPACDGEICVDAVPMHEAPTDGFTNVAATYVDCDGNGGAVYVLGGESGPDDARIARDQVWCYRDVPGVIGEVVRAGSLPAPRTQAVAVTVSGSRVLVIGGTPNDSTVPMGGFRRPYEDALLSRADGCTCAPLDPAAMESVPLPIDGLALMHDATVLHDGSVLVVGGLRIAMDNRSAIASGESILFVPDLVP